MKKAVLIFALILLVLSISLVFIDTEDLMSRLPILKDFHTNTSIEILSNNSISQIYINGKDYGVTNQTIRNLPAGQYNIQLVRVSNQENTFYKPFEFTLKLEKNSEAFVNIEIGPNNLISGYYLYYIPQSSLAEKKGSISIFSNVTDPYIMLNDEYIKMADGITVLDEGNYSIEIKKDGYEPVKIPATKVSSKNNLNLYVFLFPKPTL